MRRFHGLNPFENQVYFYYEIWTLDGRKFLKGLNPFENQVYFYTCYGYA